MNEDLIRSYRKNLYGLRVNKWREGELYMTKDQEGDATPKIGVQIKNGQKGLFGLIENRPGLKICLCPLKFCVLKKARWGFKRLFKIPGALILFQKKLLALKILEELRGPEEFT